MTPEIEVIIEDPRWEAAELEALAGLAAATALDAVLRRPGPFEVVVLGCDDARIAELNRAFRGKAAATNVLSWPSAERGAERDGDTPPPPETPELGDIALAFETCAAEARAAGLPLADHATHLVVHGLLHLLGYDHERDGDAARMEATEVAILAKLGLGDPYRRGGTMPAGDP